MGIEEECRCWVGIGVGTTITDVCNGWNAGIEELEWIIDKWIREGYAIEK